MIRYGKSNAEYLRVKDFFFDTDANARLLGRAIAASANYGSQPLREGCAVCGAPIGTPLFSYLNVQYALCSECSHLNGLNEDTPQFSRFLYEQENQDISAYNDETGNTFMARVGSIYKPKAQFLADTLRDAGEDPTRLRYADLGAGAGHFVVALHECGMTNTQGFEASQTMVDWINRRQGRPILTHNKVEELAHLAETVDADVVTMIFSLEHVQGLNNFMASLMRNPNVKYFFFAVPLFTPSTLIDVAFPHLAPRTIGLGHTHLFSDNSIEVMCRNHGLTRLAEWWFGGNAFDVIRNIALNLRRDPLSATAEGWWMEQMVEVVDGIQLAFDEKKMSSEVHILASVDGRGR